MIIRLAALGFLVGAVSALGQSLYDGVGGVPVCSTAPSSSEVLTYDGTEWCPAAAAGGTSDSISEGDSSVEVIDAGTGQVDIDLDASLSARFLDGLMQLRETGGDTATLEHNGTDAKLTSSAGAIRNVAASGVFYVEPSGTAQSVYQQAYTEGSATNAFQIITNATEGHVRALDNPLWLATEAGSGGNIFLKPLGSTVVEVGPDTLDVDVDGTMREVQTVAHGELYEKDIDGTPASSISITTGGTYYAWTTGTAGITAGGVTTDLDANTTCSALDTPYACCTGSGTGTCGDLLIVAEAGDYAIPWSIGAAGSASITAICCAFINDAAPTGNSCKPRKFPTGGTDVGSFGHTSKHTLAAGAEIDLRCTTLAGEDSKTIDIWTVNLSVARLGR